jgi:stage II sporulation protein P
VVFIYHTHASEAYLGAVPASTAARADALAFSDDPRRSIVRVGAVMAERFRSHGLDVLHLQSAFDRSDGMVNRLFSYNWARQALTNFEGRGPLPKAFPSLRLVLDVHRDHLSDQVASSRQVTTATIGGEEVARVLLVVGASHPEARTNYCFALAVAHLMDRMFPGLSRGVRLVRGSRYNQDLAPFALLLEIGSTFNTLEEAERAGRLVADVLVEALRQGLVPEPGRPYECPVPPPER